jgi:hypothetical protein
MLIFKHSKKKRVAKSVACKVKKLREWYYQLRLAASFQRKERKPWYSSRFRKAPCVLVRSMVYFFRHCPQRVRQLIFIPYFDYFLLWNQTYNLI